MEPEETNGGAPAAAGLASRPSAARGGSPYSDKPFLGRVFRYDRRGREKKAVPRGTAFWINLNQNDHRLRIVVA